MFKVVPDQLKISDGWVRCGHCADVFDATLYLETWTSPPSPPAPELPPASAAESEQLIEDLELGVRAEPAPELADFVADEAESIKEPSPDPVWVEQPTKDELLPEPLEDAWAEPSVEPAPHAPTSPEPDDWLLSPESVADAREQEQAAQELGQNLLSIAKTEVSMEWSPGAEPELPPAVPASDAPPWAPPPVNAAPAETEPDFLVELQRFAAASTGVASPVLTDPPKGADPVPTAFTEPEHADVLSADEPGFVRQAKRQALWRSPGVRVALGVIGVVLALLLTAQWALHKRDHLAASHPELAPLLARLCEPLGCEIGPVRRIDAVVIDSSTLVRRLGNFYSFDLVLKNTAAMPVAMPALELSLTDTRDSVIARRVFLPPELPGAPRLLPAQGNLSLSLRLSITDAVPMAGYRALVFYP